MVDYSQTTEEFTYPLWVRIIIGSIMVLITILTIVGNSLVTISVIKFPNLRCPTNYVIVSLAFADLTVGLAVMTLATVYEIEQHWSMGNVTCNVWITLDVMCCTSSILHISVIAVDRYIAIMKPLHYPLILTNRRLTWTLVAIWVLSFLFAFLPNYFNLSTTGVPRGPKDLERQCYYINSPIYALVTSIVTFYVPLVLMTVLYFQIIQVARKQAKDIAYTYRPPIESTYSAAQVTVTADAETTVQIDAGNGIPSGKQNEAIKDTIPSVVITASKSCDNIEVHSYESCPALVEAEPEAPKCSWDSLNGCDIVKVEPQLKPPRKLLDSQSCSNVNDSNGGTLKLDESSKLNSRSCSNLVMKESKIESIQVNKAENMSSKSQSLSVSSNSNEISLPSENRLLHGLSMFPSLSKSKLNSMNPVARILKRTASDYVSHQGSSPQHSPSRAAAKQSKEENKKKQRREYRAAKTLGLIMVGFCVCWLPFFIIYTVHPFKPSLVTSPHIPKVAVWLGYFNSCINPYLYAYTRDFRRAFYKLLWCREKSFSSNV